MRKVLHKWFWAWEFEKEEAWLNEMAMNGWALAKAGWCTYEFEKCEPGEYIIRLEFREDDENYTEFLEELGAEAVGQVIKWHYFRRKSSEGPFDLFSDIDSRIRHLDQISRLILCVGVLNLGIGMLNSVNGTHLGWINLLCATLIMYGLGRMHGKKEALEKEHLLRE